MSALSSPASASSQAPLKPSVVRKPEPPPSNRRWLVIGSLLIVVIGGIAAYRAWSKAVQNATPVAVVKTAKAFVGPLPVTLRMTGQTSARHFANIVTPLLRGPESRGSMTLLQLAKSGALVKKGELIAQIDAQTMQDHVDDLKDTIAAAENDVKKRRAEQMVEWNAMEQTLRVAKSEFDKARLEFQAAEVRTPIERELLKLSMDEADARYKRQQGDIADRKKSQDAEIRILEITLDRHKRHIARHQHDLTAFTIHAPMSGLAVMGTVFRGGEMGQVQMGDQVWPGQPIMKVVDTSSMQVEGSVSQADASDLRLGQSVHLGLDAFKDLTFEGKIQSIGALAASGGRQNNYVRSVPVRVLIEGSDPRLIPDLSAHCDILLETVPNQLQVPLGGVREENGKATVQVRSGSQWVAKEITLGKRNNTFVAVTAGLQAGDEIRLN